MSGRGAPIRGGRALRSSPRVVVLGAGPAGASTAITLAGFGIEVLLADPYDRIGWRVGEGLPAAVRAQLRTLRVWEAFRRDPHLPCSGFASCWGSAEPAFRPAVLDPNGPSWQIDRALFNRMLLDAAVAAGAHGPLSSRLTGVRHGGEGWSLTFADQDVPVTAGFVVDATGRRNSFARLLGLHRRVDSRLVAVAGMLDDPDPQNAACLIEAVPHGWWYTSRVPGGRLVTALFTDAAIASHRSLTTLHRWSDLLGTTSLTRQRTGWPIHRTVAPLRTTVAGSSVLERLGDGDWLAVGDAACAHDPLSARGLHDALDTGLAAGAAIARAAGGDREAIGSYTAAVAAGYRRYLTDLAWYYRRETRFPGTPFWSARTLQA